MKASDISVDPTLDAQVCETEFLPILRSGAWGDMGFRSSMEDVYICADNFVQQYGVKNFVEGPGAFYGVYLFSCMNLIIGSQLQLCKGSTTSDTAKTIAARGKPLTISVFCFLAWKNICYA